MKIAVIAILAFNPFFCADALPAAGAVNPAGAAAPAGVSTSPEAAATAASSVTPAPVANVTPPAQAGQRPGGADEISARKRAPLVSKAPLPEFPPCSPESDPTRESRKMLENFARPGDRLPSSLPLLDFCSEWNPEFPFNGHHCCRLLSNTHSRRARQSCYSHRPKAGYCEEMTDEQRDYIKNVESGKIPDILAYLSQPANHQTQPYCTVNNGFLAHGRPIVPTSKNRIELKSPDRCTGFGTDGMVGMLEWVGRKINEKYSGPEYAGVRLVLGDVAAPRGGCLSGISGRVGHLSHTNGQDVDVGFLTARPRVRSPSAFVYDFDGKANWWMAKQLLTNPYACVKVIFLDRHDIRKLARAARGDPDWARFGHYFRHMPGHKNHMHVRIGDAPGRNGCTAHPELEEGDEIDGDGFDVDEAFDPLAPLGDPAAGLSSEAKVQSLE